MSASKMFVVAGPGVRFNVAGCRLGAPGPGMPSVPRKSLPAIYDCFVNQGLAAEMTSKNGVLPHQHPKKKPPPKRTAQLD